MIKIVTWNTQGNANEDGKIANIINKYKPDVLCLQECGNLMHLFRDNDFEKKGSLYSTTLSFGTKDRCVEYDIYYYSWRNASRCSMATLIKSEYNVVEACLRYHRYTDYYADRHWSPNSIYDFLSEDGLDVYGGDSFGRKGLRAMIQIVVDLIGYDKDYISINNVHLPSGRPNYAIGVAKSLFYKCRHYNSYFIMIGDMNIPSFMWSRHNPSYTLHAPQTSTHSGGNILDYLFTDFGTPSKIDVGDSLYNSDHFAVCFEF